MFTPGRGYRAPVVRRGAVSLTVAGLLALLAGQPWNSPVRDPGFWLAPEGGYGARLATIRVIRRHGRSVLLRAPVVTSGQDDPQFADKARLIGQYWRDYSQGGAVPG